MRASGLSWPDWVWDTGCCNTCALGEKEVFNIMWLVNKLLHSTAASAKAWLEKIN